MSAVIRAHAVIVVDVNVLVAAHLLRHPHHHVAHDFLAEALTNDTVIVPVAVAHGCPVVTFDRDFRRFDGVGLVELR